MGALKAGDSMYKIKTLNNISAKGLERFPKSHFELSEAMADPDAILVRSQQLTESDITPSLRAVGRAGAGVNNIPVGAYTSRGIVVFNTPGANANAVKELVMAGLLLSRRGIIQGMAFVDGLGELTDKAELNIRVEAGKKHFKGSELKGKTLGVLGLGAIGSMVADMALQMGMNVLGYDPALSVDAAWRLSSQVQKMDNMQALFARAGRWTRTQGRRRRRVRHARSSKLWLCRKPAADTPSGERGMERSLTIRPSPNERGPAVCTLRKRSPSSLQ